MILRIFLYLIKLLIVYICLSGNKKFTLADKDGWIIEADKIFDHKTNPVLANGHIGFTVFDTSVYMNGLYNGKGPQTHRARIENYANLQIDACSTKQKMSSKQCRYRLNLRTGIFETIYTTKNYTVKHEVFPHRYYTRTIVNRFVVERKSGYDDIVVPIYTDAGNLGLDISFPVFKSFTVGKYNVTIESGKTIEVENDELQREGLPIVLAYTSLAQLNLSAHENRLEQYAFMLIDPKEDVVRNELSRVAFDQQIVDKHVKEWSAFWDDFDIEVDSRIELIYKVRASIFYLVSHFQSVNSYEPANLFYGVSSSGLGDVNVDNQLQGRITWDQEIYMQPVVVLMNPQWSEELLNYRYRVQAIDPMSGGWNYFWETGYTGAHLDVYKEMVKSSHVPADVAFATRMHLAATHDKKWFMREGCALAFNTAKYWAARTEYNATTDLYDLKDVRSTSKINDPITNNAFINVAVAYNLFLGEFATCMCNNTLSDDKKGRKKNWNEIARSLTLPYDDKAEYVLEHSGYEEYIRTEAADMPLVIYPFQYPLDEKIKRNTLDHYKKTQIKNSPPTTWGMHIIGDIELKNEREASSLFLDISYYYLERPFHVWTDRISSENRVFNFISGAAAYLQVIMNGYTGIRIDFDKMEIRTPKLPPHCSRIKIKGVKYLSAKFDVLVTTTDFSLTLREPATEKIELYARTEDGRLFDLKKVGDTITTNKNSSIVVRDKAYPYGECRILHNIIGMPTKLANIEKKQVNKSGSSGSYYITSFIIFILIGALCAYLFITYNRHGSIFPSSAVRYVRKV